MVRWFLALLVAGCGSPGFADLEIGPRKTSFAERFEVRKLPNGLRLVFVLDARTNLVTIGVDYAVGSGDDPHDDHGLAHYVEHVMFDAGPRGRPQLPDVALEQNAMTMFDRTYFYATALDVHALDILESAARRFEVGCTDLDDAALARERDVVIEELKYRAAARRYDALFRAIWGPTHPNGHWGGADFADISRDRLCAFIERHYGPAAAVVVVAGNVRAADLDPITARFAALPPRKPAKRLSGWTPKLEVTRITVPGLDRPSVMLVIPVSTVDRTYDAALDVLNGLTFSVRFGEYASVDVVGEERGRAIIVAASTNEATDLPALERRLRDRLNRLEIPNIQRHREQLRTRLAAKLDDLSFVAFEVSAQVARGERPSRLRRLAALDSVTTEQLADLLKHWRHRTIYALPEIGVPAEHSIGRLATTLHDVDISRAEPPALDAMKPRRSAGVHDYKLANGLRVLLAPDPDSLAIDARIVIAAAGGSLERNSVPAQTALRLTPRGGDTITAAEVLHWYASVAVPVVPDVRPSAATFAVTGFHLFGDWHVWWLAWNVIRGQYWECEGPCREALEEARKDVRADEIVGRRLEGLVGLGLQGKAHSARVLQKFRRATYRPESSTLIVSGRFDVAAMRKEIDALFGDWRAGARSAPAPAAVAKPGHIALAIEDAVTVELALGFAAPGRTSGTDWVVREIIGEMLAEHVREVRDRLGASYTMRAGATLDAIRISGSVEPAHVGEAARTLAAAIDRVRTAGPEVAGSFARARARVLAKALARANRVTARAAALQRLALSGSHASVLDQELEILRTIELATVRNHAARWLDVAGTIAVARGKADLARAALVELGADQSRVEVHRLQVDQKRSRATPFTSSADW
jgi:zinc protease